jgi:glycosyltransferase involved in cell wall biosynthesis
MRNEQKIRILVDAHVFDQEYQGSRTFVRELYRALIGRPGLEIFFVAFDTGSLLEEFPGIPKENLISYKKRSSLFRLLIDIPAIIKRYRIDYAHFQYIVPLFKHCRYIVTTHDVLFREHPEEFSVLYRVFKTILYRYAASKADILTTVSDQSRHAMEKWLAVPVGKILLTPLAVDQRFFARHNKSMVRKVFEERYGFDRFILCVSRFESRKNHVLVLKGYLDARLYEQGYYLVLLGHRSLPVPEFDALLDSLDQTVRSFLVIRNDIADADLLLFYQAATVFVYPSRAEGFGLPPLEAAAAQTPVICSHATNMINFDFFGEGHIDPNDQPGFTNLLRKMISQPPAPESLAAISNIVGARYSWQQSADVLYEHLVSEPKKQATLVAISS